MTFRKGSARYKILEGLRELKMDSVLNFMKLYGSTDPHVHQAVHEVVAGIPRNRLETALRIVENSVKKVGRAEIQEAARLYIEKTNKENLTVDENRDAVKESTAKILPPRERDDIASIVGAMGKMSKEIIPSEIDTVIRGKGENGFTSYGLTPEEIEKFVSSVREGKIGFFGNPPRYGITTPTSDLVFRNPPEYLEDVEIDPKIKIPVPPEKDFPEFMRIREAMLAEVYTLAGLTRDNGWFEEDTPGIPKEKFSRAIEFLYMIPEGRDTQYWLPHGVTASPNGVITFWWKHHRKTVTFALTKTNFGDDTWLLEYKGNFPQDNNDRFLTLQPGAIEYLIIALKKMYS